MHTPGDPQECSVEERYNNNTTALLNDLLLSLDAGGVSVLTLLDLSAAFDTTDHGILLRRLKHAFGVDGAALSWFQSFVPVEQGTLR